MDNLQNSGAPTPNLNVNIADAPYIECEECGGKVFEEKMMIKKISKFMTGSEQDSIVPLSVIACSKCGHVNELFKPKV
jgi:DNA-directed RNA polymerase subunit RPC12/RpoP